MTNENNYEFRVVELKNLLKKESEIGFEILKHLLWIEDSRIFLDRGFASLYAFCVKELGMNENQAYLRITSVREMRNSEAIKEKLESGKVSIAQVAVFASAKKERKASGQKVSEKETEVLLEAISGKTVSETKKIVEEQILPDKPKTYKLSLELNRDDFEEFQAFKSKNSHALKDQSHEEAFRLLLKRVQPKSAKADGKNTKVEEQSSKVKTRFSTSPQVKTKATTQTTKKNILQESEQPTHSVHTHATDSFEQNASNEKIISIAVKKTAPDENQAHTRTIPAHLERKLIERSKGECEYIDPFTKRKCDSTHYLQIDHILSFSKGGSSLELNNLQVLCANHNRRKYEKAG